MLTDISIIHHTCSPFKQSLVRLFCSPYHFLCRSLCHAPRQNFESASALTSVASSTCRGHQKSPPDVPLLDVDNDRHSQRRLARKTHSASPSCTRPSQLVPPLLIPQGRRRASPSPSAATLNLVSEHSNWEDVAME